MPALATRVISAICAVGLLALSYFLGNLNGVAYFSFAICAIGTWEYSNLTLAQYGQSKVTLLFRILAPIALAISIWGNSFALAGLAATITFHLALMLWVTRNQLKIEEILKLGFASTLGFLYSVFLPALIVKLLIFPNGFLWFLLLLVLTFAGDTFAYFGGVTFGKHKLMPDLSPKKSIEGAIFGLFGSLIASLLFAHFLLPSLPLLHVTIWAGLTSFLCQSGDLFESLLKRVANVKDSGKIMPGHGGVLDRLDGIYFGAPTTYLLYTLTL